MSDAQRYSLHYALVSSAPNSIILHLDKTPVVAEIQSGTYTFRHPPVSGNELVATITRVMPLRYCSKAPESAFQKGVQADQLGRCAQHHDTSKVPFWHSDDLAKRHEHHHHPPEG